MNLGALSEAKQKNLEARMARLGIFESDLEEEFVRGSGAGGQKINKTSVVVLLRHRPSGIAVRCQAGRSQAMNRFLARRRLVEKLEEHILKEKSERRQKIEKLRRQKRRRSRRAKEKMLEGKKRQSVKKQTRSRPSLEEGET
ncbi:MAG TPA: peptide chain release factor-like protein [Deltaproteobacteria bacterium]|nr:peptide chain release factor-like protein [Deltaproteobacteria bacterium]